MSLRPLDTILQTAVRLHRQTARAVDGLTRRAARALAPVPWPARLAAMALVLAATCVIVDRFGFALYRDLAGFQRLHNRVLRESGLYDLARFMLPALARPVAVLLLVSGLLAWTRTRTALVLLKTGGAAFAALWLWIIGLVVRIPPRLLVGLERTDVVFDKHARNALWIGGFTALVPGLVLALTFLLCLTLRRVQVMFGYPSRSQRWSADGLIHVLRARGRERRFVAATYWSLILHFTLICLIPLLLQIGGCQRAYRVPGGSGQPTVAQVQVQKRKKPRKRLVFNMNSAISYHVPEIDESLIRQEVEEETLNTYQAGRIGTGEGTQGGYLGGSQFGEIRFIRLQYEGGDWDQQMGKGADYNFLLKFHELTGFKIARKTEAIPVGDLKRFPENQAPPFVYITGSRRIHLSSREIKVLRWYLIEEGGMLFADNGGGNFNSALRAFMRRVLPEKSWIDIANDDPIFREPFSFPNGAPPLWHHSGRRALGIKHNGRWLVFYHQGDINDAWQTGGSGASAAVRSRAFKMGINVVHYAFRNYLEIHSDL